MTTNAVPVTNSHKVEEIRDIITCPICLEVLENPRVLSCSHTYCFMCLVALIEEGSIGPTRCPQCRAYSIPSQESLQQLPQNSFAKQIADLIREQDGVLNVTEEDSEEIYVGDSVPPVELEIDKRSKGSRFAINVLKGAATLATAGLGGLYFHAQAKKKKRERQALLAENPFENFVCGGCNTRQFYSENELRYKCGLCEDFSLCEPCALECSARVHPQDHIFVKLKFRQNRRLPPGCLLKFRKTRDMSDEIDFSTIIHSRAYYHTPEAIEWTDAISCSFCGESPITGIRYK
ncbi:uncharacterized protein [Watersipora subatra]